MIKLIDGDDRYVHGHLNFAKAVKPNPLTPVGPSVGEYPADFWPVEISEDGKRVGYSMTPPGEDE